MATLTYDPTDDPQALEAIEADEQESLELGEQLAQEQDELLAGKFTSAEELERAYIELQRKFGARNQGDEEESVEPDEGGEEEVAEEDDEEAISYELLEQLAAEAEAGEFSEETLEALDGLSPRDVAEMFLAYRENSAPETQELSDDDLRYFQDMVGGEENYAAMTQWAQQNLSQEEVNAFDTVVEKGDPLALYFAIQALQFRYLNAEGFEGEMLTGKDPSPSVQGFRSQAELVRAMEDPRYDSDPAYRADVEARLERSNDLNF